MVTKFGNDMQASVPSLPELKATDQVGFNDLLVDRDGIVRRGLLFLDDGSENAYSFPLRLSLKSLAKDGILPRPDPAHPDYLQLGAVTFRPLDGNDGGYVDADARGYQFLLDFGQKLLPLPTYSVNDLLSGQLAPELFRDKIVLVGVTAESVPDLFHTPYSASLGADQQRIFGVMLHAYATNQLLRAALGGRPPRQTISERAELIWTVFWGILGGIVGTLSRSTYRFSLFALGSLLLLTGLYWLAFWGGWWVPLVPPAMACIMTTVLLTATIASKEAREHRQLMHLFSRHVSPEVADTIWRQREHFWDGGRPRSQVLTITVLFTDLEGFTPASEKLDPQRLMDWTNSCLENMVEIIMRHGGVVDDYFGDAIKANFGVPIGRGSEAEITSDAQHAVDCALAIEEAMRRLNQRWQADGQPTARMRLGLYTGPAVAGSLGSQARLKYTTIGDTVNIAARLESFNKDAWEPNAEESPCRILLGESTVRLLQPDSYDIRRVGDVLLKGKEQKVAVFQLIGRQSLGPRVL
jgi:adenylate cyclase